MAGREPSRPRFPTPPREPVSPFDPTGIDDGKGGIALGTRRPALKATAWIALAVVGLAIAALAWRTVEREAVEQAYQEGIRALADGRADEARRAFDRALAKRPDWGAAWRQRGYAAAAPADAIADFSRAIAFDGGDADARAARGRALLRAGEPAKALDDLSQALAIAERRGVDAATVAAWRADRGRARADAGDAAGALDDLRHASTQRGAPEDHRELARALASVSDWGGAREAYDRAIAADAQPAWLGERALVLMQLGDDEAAGADLAQCVALDPSCAERFGTRAGTLARDLGRDPPAGAR